MTIGARFARGLAFLSIFILIGSACERPPMESEQRDFRGLGIQTVSNPRNPTIDPAIAAIPDPLPPAEAGPPGDAVFQNIQVLNDLSSTEFVRLMGAITLWVSPEQGCAYCHDGANFAAEGVYQKTVARRMIQMTRWINTEWKEHVGSTGVTCFTCHRGQPVPGVTWHTPSNPVRMAGFLGNKAGQNMPGTTVGLTSLPYDPFEPFLLGDQNIRIQSDTALPNGSLKTIKDTEHTYSLMVHISESLGVNCTYCHNSRAFSSWEQSSPARENAWYAIRMVRAINEQFITPLTDVFPASRKGPEGDVYKVNCSTCHAGLPKPLGGISMVSDYPELVR